MFESAQLKVSRAQNHITDLEVQFKTFIEKKPHRFSIKHNKQTGQAVIQIRFVEDVPESFSVVIGDAIHNLRCALDHTMWELMGWDGGAQDRHTQFPVRDDKTNFDSACNGIRTPSEWIKHLFIGFECFQTGRGEVFYLINSLDNSDKHRVIAPVLRATIHPPFQIFYEDGTPFLRMKGNQYIGGIEGNVEIAQVPEGGYVELDDNANCTPSVFLPNVSSGDVFFALNGFLQSVRVIIGEIESEVGKNPKP